MKRKLISGLLCFAACLLLLTMGTFADEQIEYLNGGIEEYCAAYEEIDADTTQWTEGWYIADGTVTIPARAEVSGNVNLILIDECVLTVQNGIHVPKGATLTIFAQSTDKAGTLIVKQSFSNQAAIGGNPGEDSGKITINGGNIQAECGVGIGHGYNPRGESSSEVVINGGNIDASRINGFTGSSVKLSPPAGYAMAVRTGGDGRIEGSPFTSSADINGVTGQWVHIRQVPSTTYTVTVEASGNGTVTANPTSTVLEDAVQLTAVPEAYYHFKEWQSDEVTVSKNNTFIMPDKNVTVKAIFEHDPDIPYMDENGETIYLAAEDVTIFTPGMKTLSDEWYLIDGEFTLEDRLHISGNVNIILADGCKLKLKDGINVGQGNGYCNNLTIYAQSADNAGTIDAITKDFAAAIGGGCEESSGQITINGGVIRATAQNGAAGIGGGANCGRGYVTINNGDVTAETWFGAAIGGSNTTDDGLRTLPEGRGYVTINGGTVNATAHRRGAAIGGGEKTGSEVTINGGVINAIGEDAATAIGGAYSNPVGSINYNSKITITGGNIYARTSNSKAFVIGSGGWVKADLPKGYAIDTRTSNEIEIKGSPLLSGDIYETLAPWTELHLTVGPYNSITYVVQGEGKLYNVSHSIALKGAIVSFNISAEAHSHFASCVSKEVEFVERGALLYFEMPEKDVTVTVTFEQDQITYLDDAGHEQTTKDYTVLKEDTTKLEEGWYAVWDKVQIPKRIETKGDVHLVLMDGCNLEAQGGIHVGPDSNITIYAQSTGEKAGKLTADLKLTGSEETWQCAAIGGNEGEDSGQITINGGKITVAANNGSAAGIGGGGAGACRVTVNNGDVTATARYGAGIGGGSPSKINSVIIINGGNVSGESTKGGAGIGGGNQGNAKVTINGGVVIGKGVGNGSGIGGGNKGVGFILVTGGITDGISESGEGMMAGNTGKITVSPKEETTLEVKVSGVDIEGSPFEEETNIEGKLKGKNNVHIEAINEGGASDNPKTGDGSNMLIWIIAMTGALAAAGTAGFVICSRKKSEK